MSRRRGLSSDDLELWTRVVDSVEPLDRPAPSRHSGQHGGGLRPSDLELWSKAMDALESPAGHPGQDLSSGRGRLEGGAATKSSANVPNDGKTGTGVMPSNPANRPVSPSGSLAMERRRYRRMVRGKLEPEAVLDLHGMTVDFAYPKLRSFLQFGYSDNKRLVLVITGKGRQIDDDGPMPTRRGVLRQMVPEWLDQPQLRRIVQQWHPAHRTHGGTGAYYVYLRKRRQST